MSKEYTFFWATLYIHMTILIPKRPLKTQALQTNIYVAETSLVTQTDIQLRTFFFLSTRILCKIEALCIFSVFIPHKGTVVAQWLRCCATNRKVAGSIAAGVIRFFIDTKFFRSHYGPGIDSASNRTEYQEHLLGVKAAGA